jgi:acyl-CoA synthetase (AMP-forming)/AMP-acid ligase II
MIHAEGKTIGAAFREAAEHYPNNLFLMVPKDPDRSYHPDGYAITYADTQAQVEKLANRLKTAGYGHGHRVAILLENQPEFVLVKLACNTLGISVAPINSDYRPAEIAYLLQDSAADLAIILERRTEQFMAGLAASGRTLPVASLENLADGLPPAETPPPAPGSVHTETEASLLYTSGTTGRPKGCRMGHEYELMLGFWYATRGGYLTFEEGQERLFNPLPLFHVNSGIVSLFGMMLTGNCQIQPERFSPNQWWPAIRATEATIIHYLGAVVPILMNVPASPEDTYHNVKFGVGAGLEPVLHAAFEKRFGFPLVELWGMTEFCRILADCHEPRHIDTRAIGRPQPGLEVRVVDQNDQDVPVGEAGEMLVRHSAETPRKWAYLGYLNNPEATEEAWRGGWFHTGDTVRQDETGMLFFVDRKKNIIRRSGENIAAAEVEAVIQGHPAVGQVTCIAVTDELRDEEVFACIVPAAGVETNEMTAQTIFAYCFERLAYYKAPGWLLFVDALPVTGTQKVLKHKIFAEGVDPRQQGGVYDFRRFKKR